MAEDPWRRLSCDASSSIGRLGRGAQPRKRAEPRRGSEPLCTSNGEEPRRGSLFTEVPYFDKLNEESPSQPEANHEAKHEAKHGAKHEAKHDHEKSAQSILQQAYQQAGRSQSEGTAGLAYSAPIRAPTATAAIDDGSYSYNRSNEGTCPPRQLPPAAKVKPAAKPRDPREPLFGGKTASEVANEVSDQLEEAWTKEDCKKVIKRLLLQWHPDKNMKEEEFATKVTQHIHSEVERLEQGLPRPEVFEQFKFDGRNPFTKSDSFQKNFTDAYNFYYDQVNQRGKENLNINAPLSSSDAVLSEAECLYQEAQEDLKTAENDVRGESPAYEWVCFKAHQSAEKAMKAAPFTSEFMANFSRDLNHLSAKASDVMLRRLAMKLQTLAGNTHNYSLDDSDSPIPPNADYTENEANEALQIATHILGKVRPLIQAATPAQPDVSSRIKDLLAGLKS